MGCVIKIFKYRNDGTFLSCWELYSREGAG